MKEQRNVSSKTEGDNAKAQINVAKVGLISAVVVAAIGMMGTALNAYFSSQAALAPILIPIQATQTAEASLAQRTAIVNKTLSVPITPSISPNSQATSTSTLIAPSPTLTNTARSPISDWTSVLELFSFKATCWEPVQIPNTFDLTGDPLSVSIRISEAKNRHDVDNWESAPAGGKLISIARNIASLSQNKEWIQLSNTVHVTVRARGAIPNHINVVGECAGMGRFRNFPTIPLESRFSQYESTTKYPDADYFSLQPGEFESFILSFECTTPGSYTVQISIPYTTFGRSGAITFNPPDLVCPKSYSNWTFLGPAHNEGTYVWNGTDYIKTP